MTSEPGNPQGTSSKPMRTLIVDDEPMVRADLRYLLAPHAQHVNVVAEAGSLAESEAVLASVPVDLVFLDIQMRGCDGFDIVPLVKPWVPIIFVTAFEQYAVRAFEVNAVDYLLKPVVPERLAAALLRARQTSERVSVPTSQPTATLNEDDRVLLVADSRRIFVRVRDICMIASLGGNYTEVSTEADTERPAVRRTLKQWEAMLPSETFVRVHRKALVNVKKIGQVERDSEGALIVHTCGSDAGLPVSRRRVKHFLQCLENEGVGHHHITY